MLTFIRKTDKLSKNNQEYGLFKCECGKIKEIMIGNVGNSVKSCGCLRESLCLRSKLDIPFTSSKKAPEYRVWINMKVRCYNPKSSNYKNYGGRGIKVCKKWKNSFIEFYKDMGPRPSKDHVIDRKNNESNYCKSNCRWATEKASNRNRRNTSFITHNGEKLSLSEWSEKLGICQSTLRDRKYRGWSDEKIITTPIRKRNKKES